MKGFTKFVVLGGALVAFSGLASATTACAINTGYTATQLSGLTCELGDKIFSFSSFTGPSDSDGGGVVVTLAGPALTPFTGAYNVTVSDSTGGNITSGFTLDYSVGVDTTLAALNYISTFASGILDSSTNTSTSLNTIVLTGGASCTVGSSDASDTIAPTGNCTGLNATTISVADTFTYTTPGNGLLSVSNTFNEAVASAIPEPTTFVLMGAGFALLGLRRRAARK